MNERSREDGKNRRPLFDFVTLRLLMGLIAFAIPLAVTGLARPERLESISASYHTAARDAFVGLLFVVATFLVAYRGLSFRQGVASKIGAMSAALVAVFPTSTAEKPDLSSGPVHYAAAAALFFVLAYFCYELWKATHKSTEVVERRRSPVYRVCGIVMLLCIVVIAVANWFFDEQAREYRITFYGEWVALWAFGVAWIVSGKSVPYLSKAGERPKLLEELLGVSSKQELVPERDSDRGGPR